MAERSEDATFSQFFFCQNIFHNWLLILEFAKNISEGYWYLIIIVIPWFLEKGSLKPFTKIQIGKNINYNIN